MHGLACGGKVRSNQLFALGDTGITFHGEMSLERWHELMRMLKQWKNVGTVWLADAIKHGWERFGQDEVEETLNQLEFDLVDAQRAIGIGSLTDGIRHPALTSEHYWVIARAELSPADQRRWARLAVEHGLNAQRLAQSIATGKVVTTAAHNESGRGSGIVTIQGFRQLFDTWLKKVDTHLPIHEWPEARKRELFEELRGPVRVGIMLARDLGIELEREV